jgi:uncharacterized protein with HEPN domain
MTRSDRHHVQIARIRRAGAIATQVVEDLEEAAFLADVLLVSAMAMNIQRIGEAAVVIRREFPGFMASHTDVPWSKLIGLRNLISHDYDGLDEKALWNVAKLQLPGLPGLLKPPEEDES